MKKLSNVMQVRHQQRAVAEVVLNGYNIKGTGPLGYQNRMHSFKIVKGDLWEYWQCQASLILDDQKGTACSVRIAAIPVEDDGFGLIEFL